MKIVSILPGYYALVMAGLLFSVAQADESVSADYLILSLSFWRSFLNMNQSGSEVVWCSIAGVRLSARS
jgi:hypothetical protein